MSCVTIQDLKAHLNLDITFSADNELLVGKLAAAKAWVSAYTASDVDADCTPAPVNEAILQLAAHLYANREATLVGVTAQCLPFGFIDLLANYKAFAF